MNDARAEEEATNGPAFGRDAVLVVEDLSVGFGGSRDVVPVVEHVSLALHRRQTLGLVGESGSGKSVTSLAIMRLLPPNGHILSGRVMLGSEDLLRLSEREMADRRGDDIAMVFQEPMTSLNPAFTVGSQIGEAIRRHRGASRREARERTVGLLDRVGIPNPRARAEAYPHHYSGGMRQRAMIAMALSCEPDVLIADEPTTALDVTIQAQVLDLLRDLQEERGLAILFVTHDLGVVADICDDVVVLYAGQVVETGGVEGLFEAPHHPYTEGLLASMPRGRRGERLTSIPGTVPQPNAQPRGCRFHPRCGYCVEVRCTSDPIQLREFEGGRRARCVRTEEIDLQGVE